MIYEVFSQALIHGDYVTIYRGDILVGFNPTARMQAVKILILRHQKNQRDF